MKGKDAVSDATPDTDTQGLHRAVVERLDEIDASSWDSLTGTSQPFLSHAFLSSLERTKCVDRDTGWEPRHIVLKDSAGQIAAAMPLYLKRHSWGEFVFDWSWAEAYRRYGLNYYPKLVAAVPFTPVTGTRLLTAPETDRPMLARRLLREALALTDELNASSLHILFPRAEELAWVGAAGLLLRKDCQFHWRNRGYASFDDFLATFTSSKRKKVRRERRRVQEAGLTFEWIHGGDTTPDLWRDVYRFLADTFHKRGHAPYCAPDFFRQVDRMLGDRLMIVLARSGATPVAAAVFFRDNHTLYGRYWGCDEDHHSLHFETCYYQGIEYCIANGLTSFEPGTQGEHKLSRGFLPTETWSGHHIARPEFAEAIGRYLDTERRDVDAYIARATSHLPYRADPDA